MGIQPYIYSDNARFIRSLYVPYGGYMEFQIPEFMLSNQFQYECWSYIGNVQHFNPFSAVNTTNWNDTYYVSPYGQSLLLGDHDSFTTTTESLSDILPLNKWFHFSTSFDGAYHRIFINGVMKLKWNRIMPHSINTVRFGARIKGTSVYSAGWFDEFKLRLGSAVYTSDSGFTPQTRQFST